MEEDEDIMPVPQPPKRKEQTRAKASNECQQDSIWRFLGATRCEKCGFTTTEVSLFNIHTCNSRMSARNCSDSTDSPVNGRKLSLTDTHLGMFRHIGMTNDPVGPAVCMRQAPSTGTSVMNSAHNKRSTVTSESVVSMDGRNIVSLPVAASATQSLSNISSEVLTSTLSVAPSSVDWWPAPSVAPSPSLTVPSCTCSINSIPVTVSASTAKSEHSMTAQSVAAKGAGVNTLVSKPVQKSQVTFDKDAGNYCCHACSFKATEVVFLEHLMCHRVHLPYHCLYCSERFSTRSLYSQHCSAQHPEQKVSFKLRNLKEEKKIMGLAEKGGTVEVSLVYGMPVKPKAMNEDQLSLIGLAPTTSWNIVVCPAHPVYASANTSPTSDVSVTSSVSSSSVGVTTQVSQTETQLLSSIRSAILTTTQNPSTPSSTGTFLSAAGSAEEETESLPSILILSCQGNYTAHNKEEENDQQHDSREETHVQAVAQNFTQTCSVSPQIHSPKPQGESCSQKQPPSLSSLGLSKHQQKVFQLSPLNSSPLQTPRTPVSSPQPPSVPVSAHNQPAQSTFVTLPAASHLPPQSAGTVSPDVSCFQVPRPPGRVSTADTTADSLLLTLQGSMDQGFTGIPGVDQRHSGLLGVEQRHCSLSGVNQWYGSMSSVNQRLDGLPSVDQRHGNIPGVNQRLGVLPYVDQRHGIIPGFIPGLDQRHGGLPSVDQWRGILPRLDQIFGGMPSVDQRFSSISSAGGTPNSVPNIMSSTSLCLRNRQPMSTFNTAYLPQVSTGYQLFGGYRGAVFRPELGSVGLFQLRQVGIQNFTSQVQTQNSSTRQPHCSQVQPLRILPMQPPSTISMPSRYSPISPVSDPQPIVPSSQPDPAAAALGTHVQYTSSVTPIQDTQSTHIVSGTSTASTVSRLGVSGFSRAHADLVSVTGIHSATDTCLKINIESSTSGLGVMIKKEATESVKSVAGSVLTTTSMSNSTAAHSVPKYIRRNEIFWCLQCKKKMDNDDAVYSHIWDHKHPSGELCSSCTHEDVSGRAKCLQTNSEIENIPSRADAIILSLVSKADLRERLLHNQRLFSFESSDSVVSETTGDAGDGNVPSAREESVSAGTDQSAATSDATTCGQSGSAESEGAGDARPVVPGSTDSQSGGSTTVIHSGAGSSEKHASSNAAVLTEHAVCTDSSGTNTEESTATSADAHISCSRPNTAEKIVYSNVQDLVSGNFSASDCAPAQTICLSVPSFIEATEKKDEETELLSATNSNSAVALPTETAESEGAMCTSSSQSQGDVQMQHAEQALDPQATDTREDSHVPIQHSEETIAVACHFGNRSDSIHQPQDEGSRMSTEDQTATEPQSIDLMSMFYVCSLCEYRCCLAIDFTQHLSSEHHDEEFFICHHCSYRGYHATDLINHIFNHTCGPSEMYLCPECSFRTDNLQALGVHLGTEHSAANSFRCKTCKTTFSAQDSLMAHLKENSLSLFSCSKCPACFLSKRAIKQHFQKEHSGTRAHRVIKMLLCYDRKWNNYKPPAVASLCPSSFPIASKVPSPFQAGVSTETLELPIDGALTADDELCAHDPTARFMLLEIPEEEPVGSAAAPAEWEHSLLSATPESVERNGESSRLSPSLPISLAVSLGLMAQPAFTAPSGTAPVTDDHTCETLKAMCTENSSLLPATTQESVKMSGLENDDASALILNDCSSGSGDGVGDGENEEASDKLIDLFGSDELHEAMRGWLYQEKGVSSYTCIICDKPYFTLRNIHAHLFKHSHVPATCCVYCHRATASVAALKHHFSQEHSGEPLSVIYLKVNKASLLDKLTNHRSSEDPVGYFETICDGIKNLFDQGMRMAEESEGGGEKDAHSDKPASRTAPLHHTSMESQPDGERLSDGTECVPEDAKSLDGEETIGGNPPVGGPENQQDNQPSDSTKHSGDGSRSFSAVKQEQGQFSLSCTADDGLKTQTERNKDTYTLNNKQKAVASSSIHVHSNVSKKYGPPSSFMSNFSTAQRLPTGQKVSDQPLPAGQKVTDQSLPSRQKVLDKTSPKQKMKRVHQNSVDSDSTSSLDGTGDRRVRKRAILRNRNTAKKAREDIYRQLLELADYTGDESSIDDTDNDEDFDIEEHSSLSVSSIWKGRRNFPGKQNSEAGPSTPKNRPGAQGKHKLTGLACVDKDIASGNQNSEGVPFKEIPSAKEDRQDAPRKQKSKRVSSSNKDGQCASATLACPTNVPTKNNAPSGHESDQEPLYYRYICTQCEEKATDKRNMRQHISRHLKYKVVKCNHCEVTFYSHKDVVQHSAKAHPTLLVEKHTNKDPRKEMQLDRLVIKAQRKAEKEKVRMEVTPLANKPRPNSRPVMMTTTTPKPGPLAESEIVKKGVQCMQCSHEFDSLSEFKDHSEKKHTSDTVPILHWRDSVSGAVYDMRGDMQEAGQNPYQFAHKHMCAFCGFRCTTKDAAQEHHKAEHEGWQWILMMRMSRRATALQTNEDPRKEVRLVIEAQQKAEKEKVLLEVQPLADKPHLNSKPVIMATTTPKPSSLAESEIVQKGVRCMHCSHEFDSISEFKDHGEKKHTSDTVPILHWRDSVSGAVYDMRGDMQEAGQNPYQFAHKHMCAFCGFRCTTKDAAHEHHKAEHEGWQWILTLRTSPQAKAPLVSSQQASPSSNVSLGQIPSEMTLSRDAGTQNNDVFSVRNTLNNTTDSSSLVQAVSGTENSTSGGMRKRAKMLSRAAQNIGASSSTSTLSNSAPQASQDAVDSSETSSHSTSYTMAEILHSLNRTPTSDVKLSHSKPRVELVDFVLLRGSACEEWLNACGVNALDVYGLEKEKLEMFLS